MEPHSHTRTANSATFSDPQVTAKPNVVVTRTWGSGAPTKSLRSSHIRILSSEQHQKFLLLLYLGSSVAFWLVDCVTVTFGGSDGGMEYIDRFVGKRVTSVSFS